MMKLSSSWPKGRMFAERFSGVTSRTSFAAESSGGVLATDETDETDEERIISSMSRAISSPVGKGANSIRGCGGVTETAAIAAVWNGGEIEVAGGGSTG